MASLGGNELITRIKQVARALLSGTAQTDFTHVLQEYHNCHWSNPENYGLVHSLNLENHNKEKLKKTMYIFRWNYYK